MVNTHIFSLPGKIIIARKLLIIQYMVFLFLSVGNALSQQLPVGYILYYSQRGNATGLINSLVINNPKGFVTAGDNSSTLLKPLLGDSLGIELPPACKGIISDKIFGEFIIEFDYKIQSGSNVNTSGFYFLCPVKSDDTYYAIAFSNDSLTFFFADEGVMSGTIRASGYKVNSGWNNVRIERNILNRSLMVTMNGDTNHRTIFTDPNLVMGYVGFGTHNISSFLKNVSIWAPTAFSDTLYVP